jgi:SAM-dependent methyltransferase
VDSKEHWEKVYTTKSPDAVSWYRTHLETFLALIELTVETRSSSIVDVGGGESTLVDDLLLRGYQNITVLDVSQSASELTKSRLGSAGDQVRWLVADITKIELEPGAYDLWHDRAVFHFLADPVHRIAYVRQVARSVKREVTSSSARLALKALRNVADSM